ncbi:hypothetical protein EZV62_006672 [Acer yangbiense]|uniref:Terpene cyclase/mutase family member n=1 Tax=Acer yangbiense TaxID=1000413 RepID=A0A5C7I8D1_9ROSI|nr:hypothetical protein EZV62_006672 [Acer yangbiense]
MLKSFKLTTGQKCYKTGNLTTNRTYAKNHNIILASIASNVAVNGGFYDTTIGQDARMISRFLAYVLLVVKFPQAFMIVLSIRAVICELEQLTTSFHAKYCINIYKEDLYYPHPWLNDLMWDSLYILTEPLLTHWPFNKLVRDYALRVTMKHIHYEDENSRYITIGCVEKVLCMLACWVDDPNGDYFKKHLARIPDYLWVAEDGMKMQSFRSQQWDTGFAVQALLASNFTDEILPVLKRGHEFIKASQVKDNPSGDFKSMYRHISKGSWTFSDQDHGWQVSDCTAEGLKCCLLFSMMPPELVGEKMDTERLYESVNVLLSLQNKNGGLAAWEPAGAHEWLEMLNPTEFFADVVIEHEYVECTASAIQALDLFKKLYPGHMKTEIENFIINSVRYLENLQMPDGSWYGNWGVCFTYGTWFALGGLAAAGKTYNNCATVRKAVEFLLNSQRDNGGWGESYHSCPKKQLESVIEKEKEESSDEDQDLNFKLDGVDESMYNHRTTASFVKKEESSDEDQDLNFKLDRVDESMYNHRTTASFVSSPDDPPSKKKLFYDTDFQTHKSTVHTSSPLSTIADLYSAIALLIKESDSKTVSLIKESEERQLSCFRAELNKIREEIKVGDTLGKKSTKENSGTSNQKNDKVSEEDRDGELLFKQAEKNDVQADATCNVTAMEESVGQDEAASKSDGVASKIDFEKHSSDPWADALAVSKMVEDVDNRTILDENELKEINNCVEFCIQEIVQKVKPSTKKYVQQSIVLNDLASPSVVAYDVANPSVMYKDHDKSRARKRTRFLNNHWINPLVKRLKSNVSDKPSTQDEITNVEFEAFMKTKQPTW